MKFLVLQLLSAALTRVHCAFVGDVYDDKHVADDVRHGDVLSERQSGDQRLSAAAASLLSLKLENTIRYPIRSSASRFFSSGEV